MSDEESMRTPLREKLVWALIAAAVGGLGSYIAADIRYGERIDLLRENVRTLRDTDLRDLRNQLGAIQRDLGAVSVCCDESRKNIAAFASSIVPGGAAAASCSFVGANADGSISIREPGKETKLELRVEKPASLHGAIGFGAIRGGDHKWYVQKQFTVPASGSVTATYYIGEPGKRETVPGNEMHFLAVEDDTAARALQNLELEAQKGNGSDQLPKGVRSLCSAPVRLAQ